MEYICLLYWFMNPQLLVTQIMDSSIYNLKYHTMRIIAYLLIILSLSSCDYIRMIRIAYKFSSPINKNTDKKFNTSQSNPSYSVMEFNETSRLYYLCKTWGFAKYYHNNNTDIAVKVDSILLAYIPKVINTQDKSQYNDLLVNLINSIQYAPLAKKNVLDVDAYTLINNKWMEDSLCLDKNVTERLKEIFSKYKGWNKVKSSSFVYNHENTGTVKLYNEKQYDSFSDENIRLLGLFRYWNVINYFYPLKNYMDESWDKALYESIPLFKQSNTEEDYHKAISKLTNRLCDSHTSLPTSVDIALFGKYRPPFRMININDTLIIHEIRDESLNNNKFQIGDVILEVDGQNASCIYDSLQTYVCGSTKWSNVRFLCNAVLSRRDSLTNFTILRNGDTIHIASLNKTAWELHHDKLKMIKQGTKKQLYKWINDSVAYVDLESATYSNFSRNYRHIKHAKTIIFDLRCYPDNLLAGKIADYFVPHNSTFAITTYADTDYPGLLRYNRSSVYVGNKKYFKGQIIVLVNEQTESFSEYLTMLLQANPNTITVGRSTSGSDGNVSTLRFPGGIKTIYSGIGIYYPSMEPTQRRGVKIDYIVEPTIPSVINGVDLIMEKAVSLSQKRRINSLR